MAVAAAIPYVPRKIRGRRIPGAGPARCASRPGSARIVEAAGPRRRRRPSPHSKFPTVSHGVAGHVGPGARSRSRSPWSVGALRGAMRTSWRARLWRCPLAGWRCALCSRDRWAWRRPLQGRHRILRQADAGRRRRASEHRGVATKARGRGRGARPPGPTQIHRRTRPPVATHASRKNTEGGCTATGA